MQDEGSSEKKATQRTSTKQSEEWKGNFLVNSRECFRNRRAVN